MTKKKRKNGTRRMVFPGMVSVDLGAIDGMIDGAVSESIRRVLGESSEGSQAPKNIARKIKGLVRKVQKLNADLEEFYTSTGEDELPSVDSTFMSTIHLEPYQIEEREDGCVFTRTESEYDYARMGTVTHTEELEVVATSEVDDYDGSEYWYLSDEDEVLEQIAYDRRMLSKAWRVWRSENPDSELERDED